MATTIYLHERNPTAKRLTEYRTARCQQPQRAQRKRERPHHGCSLGPYHRAYKNSGWPTIPLRGATDQHCLLYSWA